MIKITYPIVMKMEMTAYHEVREEMTLEEFLENITKEVEVMRIFGHPIVELKVNEVAVKTTECFWRFVAHNAHFQVVFGRAE